MAKTKRVQVLLEPSEFDALERLAQDRGASVAELIRHAVRVQYLKVSDRARRMRAVDFFLGLPDTPLPAWKVLKEELEDRRGTARP
jgi:hypothetical protein